MYRIPITLTGCLLLTLVGCHEETHGREEAGTLLVTRALRKDTEIASEYVCQIHAIQHIELRALERGYLEGIYVDEGQQVQEGQPMFQIMPLLYQAELDKAAAEAEFTRIEFENTHALADGNVVSPSELALAKSKLDKANAELALAQVHRDLTEIKAPFSGIMGRFHARKGSLLEEGELLTKLSDNSTVWAYFNVTETQYLEYMALPREEATPVRLVLADGRYFDQPGRVETIEADFNNETGNLAFRATFPNPNSLLRHGQTGKVLMTTLVEDALLIPQKATFEILDKNYVFVVEEGDVVRSRQITIAEELPHVYIVASGLDESERILLEGLRKVRDGFVIEPEYREPEEVLSLLELPAE